MRRYGLILVESGRRKKHSETKQVTPARIESVNFL